ncbi:MAG: Asp23/Gls24 family envelope stress response protein [Clostridia bacterium]|nr:Asp23/Gls24 family envelope stress response protein [Clostridia bacterium]
MAVNTSNAYGKITISNEAIASAVSHIALDCYGVIDLVSQKFSDNFSEIFKKKPQNKGVKIITVNNRIYIDLFVILKYGVSIATVTENLKSAIKYGIESFTGMIIDSVNVNVVGVRV